MRRPALLALLGLALAAPLDAQQPPPPEEGQSVTVTGEREDNEAERRREAARFVDSHAVRTRIGQFARWHEPVCVRTWGLPLALNARISARVMDIAEGLGIRTDRSELCRPNVRIGFTSAPQAMIEQAARRNPLIIGFHYASQRGRLMEVRQPVQAWYVTKTMAMPNAGTSDPADMTAERIDQAGVRGVGGGAGSRLTNYISSGLAHVLIFADARVAEGQEADSIAELFAFLALAQTPIAETCDETSTILNLMNPACPPERRPVALTAQDNAYLRALYRMDSEVGPNMQHGSLVLNMADRMADDR